MIEYTNGAPQMVPEELVAGSAVVAGSAERLRVLIADHDGLARHTMRTALHELDRVAIVLSTGESRDALELLGHYRPTIAILDVGLPPNGCIELIREMLQIAPQTRILTVSINDQQAAIAALRAGAIGHIHKNVEPDEFARQVLRAADGEAIIPQQLITPLLDLVREIPDAGWRPLHSRLTTREWEIIELISEGANTKHIADHLVLSETTIYSHVKSLMRKLNVHTRTEAVTAAQHLRREEATRRKHPTTTR
jgi:DNA-binding NarL/FixJ family response regulator